MSREVILLIDTHAHLCSDELWPEIGQYIERAKKQNVARIIVIITNCEEWKRAQELSASYPGYLYFAAATTPHEALSKEDPFFPAVRAAAEKKELIAIGETGLEYYHLGLDKELQKQYLLRYFSLANETGLPLIFHCREAFSDLFFLSEQHYHGKALLHCFTGTLEEAKMAIQRGWLLSFSGIATFKKSEYLREVIRAIPLESMVLETDAPYLAPQSKRGKVNEPSFILETYEMVAHIKNEKLEKVADVLFHNSKTFFSF